MKNLEQIRAAAAIKALPADPAAKHDFDRSDVVKIPALILQNGLLASTAFGCEGNKRSGMCAAFAVIASHLSERQILQNAKSGRELVEQLSKASSHDLQRATAEALSLVAYLKRFSRRD